MRVERGSARGAWKYRGNARVAWKSTRGVKPASARGAWKFLEVPAGFVGAINLRRRRGLRSLSTLVTESQYLEPRQHRHFASSLPRDRCHLAIT